jgi:hypothetical protein
MELTKAARFHLAKVTAQRFPAGPGANPGSLGLIAALILALCCPSMAGSNCRPIDRPSGAPLEQREVFLSCVPPMQQCVLRF